MNVTASIPPQRSDRPLLRVDGLNVSYGQHEVVSDVSFALGRGESLALIGESGSGKSTIARSVLRLLPREAGRAGSGARATGTIEFDGTDILRLSDREFRPLRGRALGFVPQDPAHALNAVRTIGSQAVEAAALGGWSDPAARRAEIITTFTRVGLDNPERVLRSYPHQLSGGMLQRVLIGLAVLPRPQLLVADEPTSALDVTIQKRILDLLTELRASLDIGLLLITHDLAVAAERADGLVVLKEGRVQEAGRASEIFLTPRSAYARRLQADVPALNPDRYAPAQHQRLSQTAGVPRIQVDHLTRRFGSGSDAVTAVDDVSFSVPAGTTHALVGESGSGKTTTVRTLLGLEQPDSGTIAISGEPIQDLGRRPLRSVRRHLQLVYQNPFTSLDPAWRVDRLIREPLDRYRVGSRAERAAAVADALAAVGLDEHLRRRLPGELSGGQRQRVAIARALVLRPDVLVLDEPTSALDVSVQAEIFDVLTRLQAELGLTYLFVSHDLALVRQIADTVTVLRRGRVVESGPVARVLTHPEVDYTRALVAAIPRPGAGLDDVAPSIVPLTPAAVG